MLLIGIETIAWLPSYANTDQQAVRDIADYLHHNLASTSTTLYHVAPCYCHTGASWVTRWLPALTTLRHGPILWGILAHTT